MPVDANGGPIGGILGLHRFVSSVTSARCRIFRRQGSPVFAASLLRNVFGQVATISLERHSVDAPDRFGNRCIATASESLFESL